MIAFSWGWSAQTQATAPDELWPRSWEKKKFKKKQQQQLQGLGGLSVIVKVKEETYLLGATATTCGEPAQQREQKSLSNNETIGKL